jgi:toxin CptA
VDAAAGPATTDPWFAGGTATALGAVFTLYAVLRLAYRVWPARTRERPPHPTQAAHNPIGRAKPRDLVWSPHAATIVIGVGFAVALLAVGPWVYADVLMQWARTAHGNWVGEMATAMGQLLHTAWPALLLLVLYAGALWGGWSAGAWVHAMPTAGAVARSFAGGSLMGAGSVWAPGSNDGLILIGMPLLMAHAWVAFVAMALTIAFAARAQTAWAHRSG